MTLQPSHKLALLSVLVSATILAGCDAESAPARWQQTVSGAEGNYQATLDCTTAPQAGRFQECQVTFSNMQKAATSMDSVQLEGGMPGHGHGLPTSPTLALQNKPGNYRIDGLKYNMPGRWLLGFQVNGELGEDRIIFDFMI